MIRLVLIALMLLQPLQWAWAAVHITADAAHAVSHGPNAQRSVAAVALVENALSCSLLDDGSGSHSCHDNQVHHLVDLGLDIATNQDFKPDMPTALASGLVAHSTSALAPTIERPNWIATR